MPRFYPTAFRVVGTVGAGGAISPPIFLEIGGKVALSALNDF